MKAAPLFGALVLAITTAAIAQQPPSPRSGALAPGGTGLIAGQVFEPGSGDAVSGAVVWLLTDGTLRPESARVMSDTDGRFAFVNVPAGRYQLYTEKTGYRRGLYGQVHIQGEGRDLNVSDGQVLTDVRVPVWKYAAIGGTVTDEFGEPVVGVSVRAFRKVITFGEVRHTPSFQGAVGLTDDRGMYRLAALAAGEFVVAVPSTLATFPAELMPDLSRPDIQSDAFRAISELSPPGTRANQQVGGSVIMTGNTGVVPPAPLEDVTAAYRTTLFPSATTLGEATAIALRSGEERSGVDIVLRPVRTARVSGRIVGPDGPVGPTAVRLMPSGDALLSIGTGFDVATGLSDAAGRFTLLGVPEGQYIAWVEKRLPAAPDQPPEMRPLLYGSETVRVGPGGIADLVVTLQLVPRITLRLDRRDGATGKPPSMEILVEAAGVGGRAILYPDAKGTAAVQLVPGRYIITPVTSGPLCTAVLVDGRDVSDEPLVLERDDVLVTVVCGEPATRLSGTVRDERGSPDGDAVAVVFPADRRFWTGAGLRARRKTSAFTSASGSFSMANLPPGEYLVAALPVELSDFWQDPNVLDKLTPAATRVTVGAGESRTVDVRTVRPR